MENFNLRITSDLGFEVWKDITGYEGKYQVSTYGRVRSLDHYGSNGQTIVLYKGKVLKPCMGSEGYHHVYFYDGTKVHSNLIHRLVANAFIPNFNKKREVNHIDEDKLNNNVSNLEWLSPNENANFGTRNTRAIETKKKNGLLKKVYMLDTDGNFLANFESIENAAKYVGGYRTNIWACCNNKAKTAYGYRWRYE
ncbi:NUMOD4 domain-containing protein [Fibrobacter sp.]|uniref:NUMOD4 domain-containing protein n=1 Tax=Fibrobacter sp. TaxID=35828 RepID=UPI0038699024